MEIVTNYIIDFLKLSNSILEKVENPFIYFYYKINEGFKALFFENV